jgi:hypothetical protein
LTWINSLTRLDGTVFRAFHRRRNAMPIHDALIIAGIVFAFIAFAIILAWGDYQTRSTRK